MCPRLVVATGQGPGFPFTVPRREALAQCSSRVMLVEGASRRREALLGLEAELCGQRAGDMESGLCFNREAQAHVRKRHSTNRQTEQTLYMC